jgi:hypothetical protein
MLARLVESTRQHLNPPSSAASREALSVWRLAFGASYSYSSSSSSSNPCERSLAVLEYQRIAPSPNCTSPRGVGGAFRALLANVYPGLKPWANLCYHFAVKQTSSL